MSWAGEVQYESQKHMEPRRPDNLQSLTKPGGGLHFIVTVTTPRQASKRPLRHTDTCKRLQRDADGATAEKGFRTMWSELSFHSSNPRHKCFVSSFHVCESLMWVWQSRSIWAEELCFSLEFLFQSWMDFRSMIVSFTETANTVFLISLFYFILLQIPSQKQQRQSDSVSDGKETERSDYTVQHKNRHNYRTTMTLYSL